MRGEMMAGEARAIPGVIDSLSEGFARVNRILWVLAFPVGLDLLLWLAPRVSAVPLAERWLRLTRQMLAQVDGAVTSPSGVALNEQSLEMMGQLVESSPVSNMLTLVTWNLANAAVPTAVPAQPLAPRAVFEIESFGAFLGLALAFQLAGLLIGCVYLGIVGQEVRDSRVDLGLLMRRVGRYWLSALGFIALVLAVVISFTLPASVVIAVLTLVAPELGALLYTVLMLTALFVGVWMLLYLFFLVDAIVVGELGPIAAVRSSSLVVRKHLGSSLGLIGLTLLISLGMQVIWTAIAGQPLGLGVAIIGNAYVATGLIAASMLFYRNRALPSK